jgi:hypothetical protein
MSSFVIPFYYGSGSATLASREVWVKPISRTAVKRISLFYSFSPFVLRRRRDCVGSSTVDSFSRRRFSWPGPASRSALLVQKGRVADLVRPDLYPVCKNVTNSGPT